MQFLSCSNEVCGPPPSNNRVKLRSRKANSSLEGRFCSADQSQTFANRIYKILNTVNTDSGNGRDEIVDSSMPRPLASFPSESPYAPQATHAQVRAFYSPSFLYFQFENSPFLPFFHNVLNSNYESCKQEILQLLFQDSVTSRFISHQTASPFLPISLPPQITHSIFRIRKGNPNLTPILNTGFTTEVSISNGGINISPSGQVWGIT